MQWLTSHSVVAGLVTFLLMESDWVLTVLQERQRREHHAEHYASYPLNTLEGNPALQSAVASARWLSPRHLAASAAVSAVVVAGLGYFPAQVRVLLLGYVWGLFLVVDSVHLGNLIGYRFSRRGLHGKVFIHQRTAYLIQMGRYGGLSFLLVVLALCSQSVFVAGVAIAGLVSALRQLLWLRRTPSIPQPDVPPQTPGGNDTVKEIGP